MSKIIDISHRYKKLIYRDDYCFICLKELEGTKKRGYIQTQRIDNEYICIASCHKCFYNLVIKRMDNTDFWGSLYEDREIFKDLPPLDESETESG